MSFYYQLLVPMKEENSYDILIPIKLLITRGLPKIQIIGSVTNNIYKQRFKIHSILKLHGLFKMHQILIEFPNFQYIKLQHHSYVDFIIKALTDILAHKNSSLTYLESTNQHLTHQTHSSQVYYLDTQFLSKEMKTIILNNYNIKEVNTHYPANITVILSPRPNINKTRILQSLELSSKSIIQINSKLDLLNSFYNLSIPRTQLISNLKLSILLQYISKFNFNTKNYIILPTCPCGLLFSDYRCTCNKSTITKYINDIYPICLQANRILAFSSNKLQALHLSDINQIYKLVI